MREAQPASSSFAPALAIALLVLSIAVPALADDAEPASPLVSVAVSAGGDVDALALFAPAWPGLHELARCATNLLASEDAPDEVTLEFELAIRPIGSVIKAAIRDVSPASAMDELHPCIHARSHQLRLATRERGDRLKAQLHVTLSSPGALEPSMELINSFPELGPGLLGSLTRQSGSAFDELLDMMDVDPSWVQPGMSPPGRPNANLSPQAGIIVQSPRQRVVLTVGDMALVGEAEEAVYRRVFRRHRRELLHCVEVEFQRRELTSGQLLLALVIDPEGAVETATFSEIAPGLLGVEGCMVSRMRRWLFPAPAAGTVHATVAIDVTINSPDD